jgi:hypothetical protein
MSYLKKALEVVERQEREKTRSMSPGRRRTIEEVADAVLYSEKDKIINIGRWRLTPEVEAAEVQINHLYGEVVEGRGKLIDFAAACERWRKAGGGQ